MSKQPISTIDTPQAIGTYSGALRAGGTLCLSSQISLAASMQLADGGRAGIRRVFMNRQALAPAGVAALPGAAVETVAILVLPS